MNTEILQTVRGLGDDHGKSEKRLVHVNLDGQDREIERDKYIVSALKVRLGINSDYELDLVVNGEFKPLVDDAEIKIKGGEILVSHVRRGGSSQ